MWCVRGRGSRGEGGAGKDVEGSSSHITYKVYPMMNLIQYEQRGLVLEFVFVLGLILYC